MAIDPQVVETTAQARGADRMSDLERRVRALETAPTIQVAAGAPTSTPRDGTPVVDSTAVRLYLRVGGAWRYTVLS